MIQNRFGVKKRLKASLFHGLVSVALAALAGCLVFLVWFPKDLADLARGGEIFWLLMVVDVALGPLISFVIYNTSKTRSELIRDYFIIGFIQISALIYGLYAVAESRPVYLVFVKDRINVIAANQLLEKDLHDATSPEFRALPFWGPKRICVERPSNPVERSDLMFSAAEGKDIQHFPKYYRECVLGEEAEAGLSKELLIGVLEEKGLEVELPSTEWVWLPIQGRFETWVELYFENGERSLLDIDPFLD